MAIIGYARVSTFEQHLDLQRDSLRAAGCEHIFEDLGVSAIARHRPGFEDALSALRPGDTFVIWKMDRAFRSLRQALETVERFQRENIALCSLTEHLDTSTPMGQAMFQIQNVFAELERKLISERTKAGLEAARRRGRVLGRRCKLSHPEIAWAREALEHPGQTKTGIALRLQVSPRTLRRSLAQFPQQASPGS